MNLLYYSVAKSCPTFCDPMDCSMPGFSVPHYLLEFAQVSVHDISDAIQKMPSLQMSKLSFKEVTKFTHCLFSL